MNVKKIVGLSLTVFGSMVGMILFVGLVLVRPAGVKVVTDPVSGVEVPVTEDSASAQDTGTEVGPDNAAGGNSSGAGTTSGGSGSTPTPQVAAATPKPAGTPIPAAATPKPTTAPVATPKPVATPVPTPAPVYCAGKTPCYGKTTLAQHTSLSNCWGFNKDWVINLTGYAPAHPRGTNTVLSTITCGKDIAGVLAGSVSVNGTHNHASATKTNATSSILKTYFVGYYDGSKP